MVLNPKDYTYQYFHQPRGDEGDSGIIHLATPKKQGLCQILIRDYKVSDAINEFIEIKLYSVLRCIRDHFPDAFLRIANRGCRSCWFFTRGTSTPEGKPYAVEGSRAIMLITSAVPESN